jgi:hypothetical protein
MVEESVLREVVDCKGHNFACKLCPAEWDAE